jgi:hypothetical protein
MAKIEFSKDESIGRTGVVEPASRPDLHDFAIWVIYVTVDIKSFYFGVFHHIWIMFFLTSNLNFSLEREVSRGSLES